MFYMKAAKMFYIILMTVCPHLVLMSLHAAEVLLLLFLGGGRVRRRRLGLGAVRPERGRQEVLRHVSQLRLQAHGVKGLIALQGGQVCGVLLEVALCVAVS